MKPVLLLGMALSVLIPAGQAAQSAQSFDALALSTMCGSETGGEGPSAVRTPKMSAGFGNAVYAVDSKSPEAQRWFNYGLQLAWAFAHDDATGAFAEAMRLDPQCGMCAWGYALSLGPTINFGIEPPKVKTARDAALKAQGLLARSGSERDRMLAEALVRRYAGEKGDNLAYAKAMQAAAARFPDDNIILVLTADALLVAEKPKEAVLILETVLAREPRNAGAIHFYIHATEWAGQAEKAEPYANVLGEIAPGASHLIHMPSHTFYQVGRYKDAGRVNLQAMAVDSGWTAASGGALFEVPYYGHNIRFALGGAMMSGDQASALKIADQYLARNQAGAGNWQQMGDGAAWFAYGRFADPARVLAMAAPPAANIGSRIFWRYGRGEALARQGDAAGVKAEADQIRQLRKVASKAKGKTFLILADISEEVLRGRADMLDGRYGSAARHFRKAAKAQEKNFGDSRDPPPWWYPVRRSLAAAMEADGRYDAAIKEGEAVLKRWPHDPLTLLTLSRAQARAGRAPEAETALKAAGREWSGGELGAVKPALI
jgi:hypothetical protein